MIRQLQPLVPSVALSWGVSHLIPGLFQKPLVLPSSIHLLPRGQGDLGERRSHHASCLPKTFPAFIGYRVSPGPSSPGSAPPTSSLSSRSLPPPPPSGSPPHSQKYTLSNWSVPTSLKHTAPLSLSSAAQCSPSLSCSPGKLLVAPQNPAQKSPPQGSNSKWEKSEPGQRQEGPSHNDNCLLSIFRALPLHVSLFSQSSADSKGKSYHYPSFAEKDTEVER